MAVISVVNTAHFDFGALNQLEKSLERLGVSRPMLVTDKGLVAAGAADKVQAAAGNRPIVATYDETLSNPDEASVLAALAIYRDAGCDGLVALGGGSPMDLAKAVALLATHEGPLERFGASVRGARFIGKVAPIVAIPTTSGTGSEVSVGAVVILENGRKETIVSPHLIPPVALCDPELTLGLPSLLTAAWTPSPTASRRSSPPASIRPWRPSAMTGWSGPWPMAGSTAPCPTGRTGMPAGT